MLKKLIPDYYYKTIEDIPYNKLYEQGIRCLIVWECTIRNSRKTESELAALMQKIIDFLNSDEMFKEI